MSLDVERVRHSGADVGEGPDDLELARKRLAVLRDGFGRSWPGRAIQIRIVSEDAACVDVLLGRGIPRRVGAVGGSVAITVREPLERRPAGDRALEDSVPD